MILRMSKPAAGFALTAMLLILAGCGADPDNAPLPPPPPPAESYAPPPPADLSGGPPAAPRGPYQDGLAGGPAAGPAAPVVTAMVPIANPEDLPEAERHRIYGDRYDGQVRHGRREAHRRPHRQVAEPIAAAPQQSRAAAPAAKPPQTARSTPAPAAAAKPASPAVARLQAAVGPTVASGSTLTLAAPLSQRQPGAVSLTLPQTLFDLLRQQAAKLGLDRNARLVDITAILKGDGYDITPNGAQTVRLKAGEAPSFQWQVKPGAGALGPLRAEIGAVLRGQVKSLTLPLASIEKPAPAAQDAQAATGPQPDRLIDVPGVGKVPAQSLLGAGLIVLAVLLLIALARNASEAKEAMRRRRTTTALHDSEPAPDTVPAADRVDETRPEGDKP